MSNSWFRLYSEFATDPKVQMLDEKMQRRLVMLFCFRCNVTSPLHDDEITFQLRISSEDWQETKRLFIARNFIDEENNITNWDKRQYLSDSSSERVRRHREAKKRGDVTICNVTVTPPDTEQIQNRTEYKKNICSKISIEGFDAFWELYPRQRRGNKQKAEAAYRQALSRCCPEKILDGLKSYADSDEVKRGFAKTASAWLNDDRWDCNYQQIEEKQNATHRHNVKESWTSEGKRLAAKYAAEAERLEREEQAAAFSAHQPGLCPAETVRQISGGA